MGNADGSSSMSCEEDATGLAFCGREHSICHEFIKYVKRSVLHCFWVHGIGPWVTRGKLNNFQIVESCYLHGNIKVNADDNAVDPRASIHLGR